MKKHTILLALSFIMHGYTTVTDAETTIETTQSSSSTIQSDTSIQNTQEQRSQISTDPNDTITFTTVTTEETHSTQKKQQAEQTSTTTEKNNAVTTTPSLTVKKVVNNTKTTTQPQKKVTTTKSSATPTQGKYHTFNQYVTIKKGNAKAWKNFKWVKKYNNSKLANNTYLAKGYYRHKNGSTYYSLYNHKGTWMGYINAKATKLAKGAQGTYFSFNKQVKIKKGTGTAWKNFKWVKKYDNKKIANKQLLAKGYYHHANGKTYYSLYQENGTWMGYYNAKGATLVTTTKTATIKATDLSKIKEKTPIYSASMSQQFEKAVNQYRKSKNRYTLPIKSSLQSIAKKEAKNNTHTDYLKWRANHGRDGISTTFTIIGATTEALAIEKAMQNFKNSPLHNQNLLDNNRQYTSSFGGAVYVMKTTIGKTPVYQVVVNGYFGTNY